MWSMVAGDLGSLWSLMIVVVDVLMRGRLRCDWHFMVVHVMGVGVSSSMTRGVLSMLRGWERIVVRRMLMMSGGVI